MLIKKEKLGLGLGLSDGCLVVWCFLAIRNRPFDARNLFNLAEEEAFLL